MVDVARRRALPPLPMGDGYGYGGGSWYAPRAEFILAKGGTIYIYDAQSGRVRTGTIPSVTR